MAPARPRLTRQLAALAALALAALGPEAAATGYRAVMSAAQLDQRATVIARGRVEALRPEKLPGGLVQTIVTIAVDEVYRGRPGPTLEVVAPGGSMEGTRLHIDGAPEFPLGEEVLVFAKGRTIVGFGQGAFAIEDGVARRTLGNAIEGASLELDLDRAFGRPAEAEICQHNRLDTDYAEGWTLRAADIARVAPDEEASYELTLVRGNEYRLQVCTDGEAEALGLRLVDEQGLTVARTSKVSREADLRFTPDETGVYYAVLDISDHRPGVLRSAAALSVEFR